MAIAKVERNITLDIYNHDTTPSTIKAIACDNDTRYVAAEIQNGGDWYDIGSDSTVQLTIIRPDKVGVAITGQPYAFEYETGGDPDPETGELSPVVTQTYYGVYAELDQPALALPGDLLGQFKITNGTQVLRTEIFQINNGRALDVEPDSWAGEYDRYDVIATELLERMEAAQNTLEQARSLIGSPLVANTAADMADTSRIYVYTGSETGYTNGHWYYYNGSAWTDGGVYNAVAVDTDTTLTIAGKPADSKKTGDEISQIKEDFNDMVNSAYVTDSASGSMAHFTDGANDVSMKSVVIDTESASATVTRTGKNIVNFADLACEANAIYTKVLGTVYLPAGTYTFSASIDKTITATRNRLRIAYDDIAVYGDEDFTQIGRSSSTFTLDSAKTVTLSWWYHTLSESIVLSDIQLEYAPADTEYEAYNGNTYNVTLVNGVVQEEIKSLLGINNVWSDAGDVDVEYRADTKLYIKRLTDSDTDMIADANIASGQYFMVGNDLYKATVNIASGAQIVVGTNATKVSLSEALNQIKEA